MYLTVKIFFDKSNILALTGIRTRVPVVPNARTVALLISSTTQENGVAVRYC